MALWVWAIGFDSRVIPNNHKVRRVPCKKNRTQFESKIKKAIQKVNWEDKLETPCR